jgi:hypothetical protein
MTHFVIIYQGIRTGERFYTKVMKLDQDGPDYYKGLIDELDSLTGVAVWKIKFK